MIVEVSYIEFLFKTKYWRNDYKKQLKEVK